MAREKTQLRHITADGHKIRVTKEDGKFFIGNTDERAEGKMTGARNVQRDVNAGRQPHQYNNPFYGSGQGEWDDYAHTADDL